MKWLKNIFCEKDPVEVDTFMLRDLHRRRAERDRAEAEETQRGEDNRVRFEKKEKAIKKKYKVGDMIQYLQDTDIPGAQYVKSVGVIESYDEVVDFLKECTECSENPEGFIQLLVEKYDRVSTVLGESANPSGVIYRIRVADITMKYEDK